MLSPAVRRRWLLLIPLAMIAGLMEAGAAGGIYGFILVFSSQGGSMPPWLTRFARVLPLQNRTLMVVVLAASLAVFYLIKSVLVLWVHYRREAVSRDASAELSCALMRRYLLAPYPFHLHRNSADLIRNCTRSVEAAVAQVLGAAMALALECVVAAGVVVVLVRTSPGVATAAAILITAVTTAIGRLTRRTALRFGEASHALNASTLKSLQQSFGAIKELKVLRREQYFSDDFAGQQARMRHLGDMWITLSSTPAVVLQAVLVCGALLLVALTTAAGYGGGDVLAIVAVFGYAGMRLIPAAQNAVTTLTTIRAQAPAVAAIHADFQALADLAPEAARAGADRAAFASTIELRDVSFVYPGADDPSLHHVSLTVRRGASIGIVGPTGAGKSTLVDVILGLLKPTTGAMLIDGADAAAAALPWRQRVGYVPQGLFLLDDTLRRNIALGIPDREIDETRLREVIRVAQLEAFVAELPRGLDTTTGERGVRLSGGERQRVAIARALYHDPDLLIFDEATSSLDLRTEAEVGRTIDALRGVKTMIVIAHRLATVRRCDTLVWLRAGRIAAIGSFEDLARADDEFQAFAAPAL
jgi:ATP-binding cassette, subfamily B, bacterial PglK